MEKDTNKQSPLNDENWHHKVIEIYNTFIAKKNHQLKIPSYYDSFLIKALDILKPLNSEQMIEDQLHHHPENKQQKIRSAIKTVNNFILNFYGPRFVSFSERTGFQDKIGELLFANSMIYSQGVNNAMHWKGIPLIKSVFDYNLYPLLLWNEKPKTIIEIGSGTGASAIWMTDLMKSYGLTIHTITLDLVKVKQQNPNVIFLEGDAKNIPSIFPENMLKELEHPWLIVHDEHYHISLALSHFSTFMKEGDYFFIEDSRNYQDEIEKFLTESKNTFLIDTMYTDYFGRNATSAENSILVRT